MEIEVKFIRLSKLNLVTKLTELLQSLVVVKNTIYVGQLIKNNKVGTIMMKYKFLVLYLRGQKSNPV
jgi:hypothetical protein